MEELVPEAEEGGKKVGLLKQDLHSCREEMLALRQEKEDMEQSVSSLWPHPLIHYRSIYITSLLLFLVSVCVCVRVRVCACVCVRVCVCACVCVQLEDRISELQAGIAAATQGQRAAEQQSSDYRLQLDTLRDTQTSLQVCVCGCGEGVCVGVGRVCVV